jgi:hypothetical protein
MFLLIWKLKVAQRPIVPGLCHRADCPGVGGIFEDLKMVLCGECGQRGHVRESSGDVNGNDGPGARRDLALGIAEIDAQSVRFDVGENWNCADGNDRAGGGDERVGGNDYLIAGEDADGAQAGFDCGRPVRAGDAVFHMMKSSISLFEAADLFAVPPLPRLQHLEQGTPLGVVPDGPARPLAFGGGSAAMNRQA